VCPSEQPAGFLMFELRVSVDADSILVALFGSLLQGLAQPRHGDLLIDDLLAQLGRVGLLLQRRFELEDVGLEPADLGPQLADFGELYGAAALLAMAAREPTFTAPLLQFRDALLQRGNFGCGTRFRFRFVGAVLGAEPMHALGRCHRDLADRGAAHWIPYFFSLFHRYSSYPY